MRIVTLSLLSLMPLAAQAKVDFVKQIAPILVARCIECHGPKEQEGDLRLDAREFVFAEGEQDYWSVIPKDPGDSELVLRLGLDLDDEDIMPAKGDPLSKAQQALFARWITEGAHWPPAGDEWIAAELAARVLPKITFDLPVLGDRQRQVVAEAIQALRAEGVVVHRIAADTQAVEVNLSLLRDRVTDKQLQMLRPLAPVLVWLNASRTALTDEGARHLGALPQLRRLNVANTKLGDAGFDGLLSLKLLEHLNAYGTGLSDQGLAALASLPKLRRLYAWQTQVSKAGVRAVADRFAHVQVDLGDYVEQRLAAAAKEIEARSARNQPINATCPVTDKAVDEAYFVVHEGRRIAFCCVKCKAKFEQEPAKFWALLQPSEGSGEEPAEAKGAEKPGAEKNGPEKKQAIEKRVKKKRKK